MPRFLTAVIAAAVVVALSVQPAVARSRRLRDQHVAGVLDASIEAMSTGIQLELSDLHIRTGSESGNYFQLANASIGGNEVACINCNTELFARWVRQTQGIREAGCKTKESDLGSKHPNSPGYKKWQAEQAKLLKGGASFIGTDESAIPLDAEKPCNFTHFHAKDVQVSVIKDWDLEALRPRLQMLWAQRRLVVGYGANPLHQQMDFVEALMSLARKAPLITPVVCDKGAVPECGAVFGGLEKTTSLAALNTSLGAKFGADFLEKHRFRKEMSESEQRSHVQAVLTELKKKYWFYYQKCLVHEKDTATCNEKADSQLLGQVACQDQDDQQSDDCVYAELRFCSDCKKSASFFEYSRFHGPLGLFETANNRKLRDGKGLMGQCEEFSRAGHAILALLGYEVRYVLDFTDHVWIEVKLPAGPKGEWTHADPSEGVMGNPLMYEKGWGKKLTMIFAFTPWTVEHVTSRYTANYPATVMRRGIGEDRLNSVVAAVNHRLKYELPVKSWGHAHIKNSKDRNLREVALWSHFERA